MNSLLQNAVMIYQCTNINNATSLDCASGIHNSMRKNNYTIFNHSFGADIGCWVYECCQLATGSSDLTAPGKSEFIVPKRRNKQCSIINIVRKRRQLASRNRIIQELDCISQLFSNIRYSSSVAS